MKKYLAALTFTLFAFGAVQAQDLPCFKCHTSSNPLPDRIKRSGAKSAAELVDFLRNKSTKKALHKAVTDDDIKRAFEQVGKK